MPYIGKSPTGSGVRQRYHYTATGGETSLSGADDNSKTLKFTDGEYVDVYLNGVLLVQGTDYGVGTANTISSLAALAANDIVEVIVYDIYNVAKINSEAVRSRHYFTATGGETSIGTSQIGGLSFPANADIDVKLNGVTLVAGTDYNTTTANTVGGLTALTAGQVVEIVIYEKFQLADTVSKASGGTFGGPVTFDGALTSSNAITSSNGIKLGGTASTNNLSYYDEGDFTSDCKVSDALGSGNESSTACSEARWTRIGRVVYFHLRFSNVVTTGMTANNQVHIHGLPFNPSGGNWIPCTVWHQSFTGLASDLVSIVGRIYYGDEPVVRLEQTDSTGTDTEVKVNNLSSGSSDFEIAGFYFV